MAQPSRQGEPTFEEKLATLKADLKKLKKEISEIAIYLKKNDKKQIIARLEKNANVYKTLIESEKELRIEKNILYADKAKLEEQINNLVQQTAAVSSVFTASSTTTSTTTTTAQIIKQIRNAKDFSDKFRPSVGVGLTDRDDFHLIIDNPEITRRHPMIDMNIKEVVDRVLSNADDSTTTGPRIKSFFAIVTGMGRGKTRTLVEMDAEINNNRKKASSVAITYNHRWEMLESEEIFHLDPNLKNNPNLKYAITVVTRILSVYYRLPHADLDLIVRDYLLKIALHEYNSHLFIIRECLRYIIRQERESNKDVETFVLMMDESKRIETSLGKNIHAVLRNALLDTPLFEGLPDKPVNIELVMSCLNVHSTGVSESGRNVRSITTPEVLTPAGVLNNWFLLRNPVNLTPESKFKLLKLITTMHGLPRALQYCDEKFHSMVSKLSDPTAPWTITASNITDLYSYVRQKVKEKYFIGSTWKLSPKMTKALLFGEEIALDEKVMELISDGVFTNALAEIAPFQKTFIIPKTTIMTMDLLSVDARLGVPSRIREIVDSLTAFMMSTNLKLGYPLEEVTKGIISARLLAIIDLASPPSREFSIYQMFSLVPRMVLEIGDTKKTVRRLKVLFKTISARLLATIDLTSPPSREFSIYQMFSLVPGKVLEIGDAKQTIGRLNELFKIVDSDLTSDKFEFLGLRDSYTDNGKLFLSDANVVMKPFFNLMRLRLVPSEGECVDDGFLLRRSINGILTLMIDCKGLRELPPPATGKATVKPPVDLDSDDVRQARHFMSIYDEVRNNSSEQFAVNVGSLADSMRRKDAVFVYLTTRKEKSFVTDGILFLGDSDTRNFLGFMEPLYTVCRSSVCTCGNRGI